MDNLWICVVNMQFSVNLLIFTEEILHGKG